MILAASHLVDISPGADSLGAGLVRVIAGSVAAGGLYLLACALVLHLLATRAGWWEAAPAVPRLAGMGLAVVVVGLGIGYPAGGADLGPTWAFARLAGYLAVGAGVGFLAGRALQARRVHPRR
jgi:hypothetical protein